MTDSINNTHVLYISYDGMTDPLGQSQVLPYVVGLSQKGYRFTILSFEKSIRFENEASTIQTIISNYPINWIPLSFSHRLPFISKIYDLIRMYRKALSICKTDPIQMIHCRSYQAAYIARIIKKKTGLPYLFDMRGFWVDERSDGGIWNVKNPVYKRLYKLSKAIEKLLIQDSTAIISLTEAGKQEIETWDSYQPQTPIYVIPCSVDMDLFNIPSDAKRIEVREALGFSSSDFVMTYLGSFGTWYLMDQMLLFFKELKRSRPESKFLAISKDAPHILFDKVAELGMDKNDFTVVSSSRANVPFYLSCSNMSIFFIKQSYSKIASSPTKLGEILSMGIPVICNDKVGDVAAIVKSADAGIVLSDFSSSQYQSAIQSIDRLLLKTPIEIRTRIKEYYNLQNAIDIYQNAYQKILE